jgi:hypothetical protein
MMKQTKLVVALILFNSLWLNCSYAFEPKHLDMQSIISKEAEQEVSVFKEIMKNTGSYAFLLSLEEELPNVAKTVSSIALLHELKAVNVNLQQLLKEVKKFNKLLKQEVQYRSFMK